MKGYKFYEESLKREVVFLVQSGQISREEARRKYKINGHPFISKWISKFEGEDSQNNMNNTIYVNESNDVTIHNRSGERQ